MNSGIRKETVHSFLDFAQENTDNITVNKMRRLAGEMKCSGIFNDKIKNRTLADTMRFVLDKFYKLNLRNKNMRNTFISMLENDNVDLCELAYEIREKTEGKKRRRRKKNKKKKEKKAKDVEEEKESFDDDHNKAFLCQGDENLPGEDFSVVMANIE